MGQLRPGFFQPLDADRLRRAQFLGEEAHPQFFEQPAEFEHAGVLRAFALGHQAPVALLLRFEFGHALGVAGGVGAVFVQAQGDGLEIARKVLQLGPRGGGDESFGHEALQLLGAVCGGLGRVLGVLDLAHRAGVLGQDDAGQARDFVGDQGQAAPALFHALFEGGFVGGQRVLQKGAVDGDVDDLLFELFAGAQGHIGHRHFLQVGDVFLEVLERILDLQGKQAAEAFAVLGGSQFRLVKDFDAHMVATVHQGRKANQGLAGLADFHQLGEFAEGPGGVLGVCGDGVRARVSLREIGV